MSFAFSSEIFPSTPEVRDHSGLPWGCVVQPFAEIDSVLTTSIPSSHVARCSNCFAYINPFVRFNKNYWTCSLCRTSNRTSLRYVTVSERQNMIELVKPVVEYIMDEKDTSKAAGNKATSSSGADESIGHDDDYPVYVFLVDVAGDNDYVELVKSALIAALEGLSPKTWVGLAVFSHKIGLYDLRSHTPHVKYARIPVSGPCSPSLEDLLPLDDFLVRLGEDKENICAAIESISSMYIEESETSASSKLSAPSPDDSKIDGSSGSTNNSSGSPNANKRLRGFGSTLEAIVNYLASDEYNVNARVFTFLSGLPNYGSGALKHRIHSGKISTAAENLLVSQTDFYRIQAETAAKAGVCLDLYVVSPPHKYVDLATLKYLSVVTGGNMMLYDRLEDASLPQDVFRQIRKPQAFRGLLRFRTSEEFQLASVYGHLIPDDVYENLFHLAGCDQRKTIAIDFEFTRSSGFTNYAEPLAIIQMAFAYTVLDPTDGEPVRRLRVVTVKLDAGGDLAQLYQSTHADVVMALLTQQVIQSSLEKDIEEARDLLHSWIVNFTACYNRALNGATADNIKSVVDILFLKSVPLQFIPRFVYALLRNPMLSTENVHPDLIIYLHALEPDFLSKALYPALSSFTDPSTLSKRALYLTRAAVESSGDALFLLDTFTDLIVYYAPKGAHFPCPPPQDSELRQVLKKVKDITPLISPHVEYVLAGTPGARAFEQGLVEEANASGFGFSTFIESVTNGVIKTFSNT